MKTSRLIGLALGPFLATAAVGADAAPGAWKEFRCKEGSFRVLLPGTPKYLLEQSSSNKKVAFHNFVVGASPNIYVVAYASGTNQEVKLLGADFLLDSFRRGLLKGIRGNVLQEKTHRLFGGSARDLIFGMGSTHRGISRSFMLDGRFYALVAVGPNDEMSPAQVNQFLGSFRPLHGRWAAAAPASAALRPKAAAKASRAPKITGARGGWQWFRHDNGGFAILSPASLRYQRIRRGTPERRILHHKFVCVKKADRYQVSFADYPAAFIAETDPQALLDDVRNELVEANSGTLALDRRVVPEGEPVVPWFEWHPQVGLATDWRLRMHGHPGCEFRITMRNETSALVRLYLVGNRLYQVAVLGPTDNSYSPEMMKFLDSFRLLKKTPAPQPPDRSASAAP